MTSKVWNPTTNRLRSNPVSYLLEDLRLKSTYILTQEYLIFLGILFGSQIQSGDKQVRDFGHMTMLDVQSELLIRTRMMQARTNGKLRAKKKENEAKQAKLLESLVKAKKR